MQTSRQAKVMKAVSVAGVAVVVVEGDVANRPVRMGRAARGIQFLQMLLRKLRTKMTRARSKSHLKRNDPATATFLRGTKRLGLSSPQIWNHARRRPSRLVGDGVVDEVAGVGRARRTHAVVETARAEPRIILQDSERTDAPSVVNLGYACCDYDRHVGTTYDRRAGKAMS